MTLPMGDAVTTSADRRPRSYRAAERLGARRPRAGRRRRRRRAGARSTTSTRRSSTASRCASSVTARAAEDVSQDVFVGFWERPAAFDPDAGQPAHLARHAHAPSCGRLRAPRGGAPPPRRARGEPGGDRARRRGDGDRARHRRAGARRARRAADEQRRAIQLAYFGGKTYRQVAEMLGIPEGTAKSRLRLGAAPHRRGARSRRR